ncbi:M48 family metalloprotease [Glaciecola siphonariae]|uniref:Putative beta-barrel assembly-enhancing protease n=1 Tax=Glaciecola siphonariae TaxID=521012 RepID=A0ABV9LUL4_9ALTE
MQFLIIRLFIVMSALASALTANAQTNGNRNQLPEIGVVASSAITIDKEKIVGDTIMRQLRGQAPLVQDPVLQEYIQDLGNRLVVHADNTKFPFTFFMINNPVLNAFAFYGGHIGVHTGLIAESESESELASVLAHEIAHVTQRHLARRLESQQRSSPLQIASMIGSLLVAMADPRAGMAAVSATMAGGQQANINFTRNNEQEADNIGINILYRAGFDPKGAPSFFGRLAAQSGSRSSQLAFLQTHPLPQDRVAETITRARAYGEVNLPDSLPFHLARARIQARYMSNPERNLSFYESQVRQLQGVKLSAAKYGLAISLFELEQYSSAEEVINALLKDDPENLFYLDVKTDVLLEQQRFDEAINLLKPLRRHKPHNQVLALNLANSYLKAADYDSAIEILRDLLLVDSNNILSYQLLNDAYERTQQKKEAHKTQAEIYALILAYPLAIDELQFAYNYAKEDNIEKQRILGRIDQLRSAQANAQRLSL